MQPPSGSCASANRPGRPCRLFHFQSTNTKALVKLQIVQFPSTQINLFSCTSNNFPGFFFRGSYSICRNGLQYSHFFVPSIVAGLSRTFPPPVPS
ncbi:hypothetical protein VFPPC_16055 [Pochonia chlamydosporia 170]|uniref:Uncharacterized protein n=1 Tax=Pochonia chlamydosporia 170 TaxID=1380566 RepID=A0A179FM61_METCM|nr:hypothetical protein VFPPC_16055 [Pochonia chlamydosporia 170]OAQ66644.2 hypothetical protein VFPPC_16055 [Pochonia chlamydosporia 170]